jgi:flagellin-specific chaperone FliS
MTWEPIEAEKAKQRQAVPGNQHTGQNGLPKKFTGAQVGDVRDIIARRVGLGSGVTYEKGKEVVQYMDRMYQISSERGDILRMTLNDESINAASKLMKKYIQKDEEALRRQEEAEVEKQKQQKLRHQRYLDAVRKAEHCQLYRCKDDKLATVANLSPKLQWECRLAMCCKGYT